MLKTPSIASILKLTATVVACFAALASFNAHAGILDGLLRPNNYYQCILDRMPGTTADDSANEISAKCLKESPLGAPIQKQTGFFAAFHSGSECTFKKIKDTASPLAKQIIQYCCYSLYQTGSSNQ